MSCSPQWSPLHTKCANKTQLRPELVTLLQPHDIRHHFVATKTAKCVITATATKEGNCEGNRFRSADVAQSLTLGEDNVQETVVAMGKITYENDPKF